MSSVLSPFRAWGVLLAAAFVLTFIIAACGDDEAEPAATATVDVATSPTEAPTTAEQPVSTATDVPPSPTSEPTATPEPPTATALPVVTDAELVALAEAIFVPVGDVFYGACDNLAEVDCPITIRLQLRVAQPEVRLCRCQNSSSTREIEPLPERLEDGGGIVRVVMYEGNVSYDLVVVATDEGWLVDDEYCGGEPETSIYADAGPC